MAVLILLRENDRNVESDASGPTHAAKHLDGCSENIWRPDGKLGATPRPAPGKLVCRACSAEWDLWNRIVKDTGDRWYGELAIRGLQLVRQVVDFHRRVERLSPMEYDLLDTVYSAKLEHDARRQHSPKPKPTGRTASAERGKSRIGRESVTETATSG